MKNLLSISFIIIYIFGNTEFGQVFNMPALLQHYHQHHAADHKVNFMCFLVMHYCTDDGNSSDDEQDGKLPFKQIHHFSFTVFTTPAEQRFTQCCANIITKEKLNCFSLQDIEPVYLNTPIQPPRFI